MRGALRDSNRSTNQKSNAFRLVAISALASLARGSQHITQIHVWSRRADIRERGGLADSCGKGCAEVELESDEGGERHTEQEEPDFHEGSRRGICFHGANLVRHQCWVLIERFHGSIEPNDDGESSRRCR